MFSRGNMSDDQQQFNSIEEIEDNKTKWNLTSDLKLLRLLNNTSHECMDRMQKNLNGFDDLNFKADTASNKVNNLITDILILTNTKFIENRVYDEDLKDITTTTSKNETVPKTVDSNHPPLDDEQKLIKKLENSVNKAMEKLSVAYDISQADLVENNKYNLLHTLYTKKNRFSQKSLPYIIGSDEFLKDTFVGLKDDVDFSVLVPHQQQQQQQQTIDGEEHSEQDVSKHIDSNVDVFDEPHQNHIIQVNDIDQPELSAYKLPENLPPIVNNINNLFDSVKPQMPVYSDSSEDEDIFTRPSITKTNIINGVNTLMNNDDDDDEQDSTLFKSTNSDEKDDLFKDQQDDDIDFVSQTSNQPKISNQFLDDEDEDEDFDNIFNPKSSQKVNLKPNTNVFSSDDDNDDDDFFAQISKSSAKKNKVSSPPPPPLPQESTVDILKNEPIVEPILEASKPKSSASTIPKINDIKSKKEELSNVINELNSVLQKKISPEVDQKVFSENSSIVNDGGDDHNESVHQNKTISEEVENINDDFNSMLKHKTRLNSKRTRKPPSKFKKSTVVQAPPEPQPEEHSESDDLFGVEVFQRKDPVERKLDKIQAEPEEHSDLDDIFISSVSVAKVAPSESLKRTEPEMITKNNIATMDFQKNPEIAPNKQNDLRSKSIFDSSDDSDEDIFNIKSSNVPASSLKNTRKTVSSFLNSDSESDNEAKLSINRKPDNVPTANIRQQTTTTTTTTTTTPVSSLGNEISNETKKKQVKSIFDDDDSDDDLFKF